MAKGNLEEPSTLHDGELEKLEGDDLVGLTLRDTYALTQLLGQGGMARVYLAQHTRIPAKRYAVKVLRSNMAERDDIAARFEREAHAIASVVHPNIVDIIDVGTTPGERPYIVTEYLQGVDLASLIVDVKRVETLVATRIARHVCRGIGAAHGCGVIHRDLKPGNVFLVGDLQAPHAKVLDFGLARMIETGSTSLTRSGIAMGTPAYMAPEQARAEQTDQRTDVYAIGGLLYVMLTGVPPYSEDSPQATVLAVMDREPTRPRSHAPSIPQRLEAIIQRAMARDPADRFASAAALEAELEAFERDTHAAEERVSVFPTSLRRDDHAHATEHDRTRLIAVASLGAVLLALWLSMAVHGGLGLFILKRPPTGFELALAAFSIIGTIATPGVLGLRYLRRRIWHNSARVAELLSRTRAVVYSATVAYGLAALSVRAHDAWRQRVAASNSAAWVGWDMVLCSVAVLVGAAVAMRGSVLAKHPGRVRRILVGPVAAVVTLSLVGLLMRYGFEQAPRRLAVEAPAATTNPSTPAPTVATAPPIDLDIASAAPLLSAHTPPDASLPTRRATIAELHTAKTQGLVGWLALAERCPADPHVLEPLALAYGEKPENHVAALDTLVRLFQLDRVAAKGTKVRALLLKLAFNEKLSDRTLQVMADEMGTAGPDLLYDLYVTTPNVRDQARGLLLKPATRAHATQALLIAFDIRSADSCEARLELLPRASTDGDQRAVATLVMLSNNTRKGCGFKKRFPCPPPCAKQALAFQQTVKQIQTRLKR